MAKARCKQKIASTYNDMHIDINIYINTDIYVHIDTNINFETNIDKNGERSTFLQLNDNSRLDERNIQISKT